MGDPKPTNSSVFRAPAQRIFSLSKPQEPNNENTPETPNIHPWGIFFTILGTVLLDFDADACQSPARAYLLDVTVTGKRNQRQSGKIHLS